MNRGAIILCGGRSSRLGTDKAMMPFGAETMLERVVRIVSSVVAPSEIVVAAAANQKLTAMSVCVAADCVDYQGPLPAIASGLAALPATTKAVFVTGCDTPLILPKLIEFLFEQLGDFEAVVPKDADRIYPLCAVYRKDIADQIGRQLTKEARSLHQLTRELNTRYIPTGALLTLDPQLKSLYNVNTRSDYDAALAAGLSKP